MSNTSFHDEEFKNIELIGGPLDGQKLEIKPLFPVSSGLPKCYSSLLTFKDKNGEAIYYTVCESNNDHYLWSTIAV